MQITLAEYLKDPCGSLSLPYKKAMAMGDPVSVTVTHGSGVGEGYFRLLHRLENVQKPCLPVGFCLGDAENEESVTHINSCYHGVSITCEQMEGYDKAFVVLVKAEATGEIAASGIAELDPMVKEGYLEWIQVSRGYRRRGLGAFVVKELLWQMKDIADFVTVSGKVESVGAERLYRFCGFTGDDVWYVKREEE